MIDNIEKFKIGIIGGGHRCKALLESIFKVKKGGSHPDILGVADTNDQAVGLRYAREKGIFTTNDYRDLFSIEDLELVLELTQDDDVKQPPVLGCRLGDVEGIADHGVASYELVSERTTRFPWFDHLVPGEQAGSGTGI